MGLAMALDIKNPFKDMSKPQIYASIAGATLIGGYFVVRHHSQTGSWNPWSSSTTSSTSAAASTGATSQTIDPATGLPVSDDNAIDPITGLTYLAEAQQYGSVQAAEADVSQFGQTSVSPDSPAPTGSTTTSTGGTPIVGSATYTSNAAWVQAATAGLADIGYSATDVATALGAYITSTPVSAAQAKLIQVAIAEFGDPPVGTFQIIQQPTTKTGSNQVSGKSVTGLKVASTTDATEGNNGSARITWDQTPGATSYSVFMDSKGATSLDTTLATESELSPGSHEVMVTPEPGGKGTSISFTIKKSAKWTAA